jgi:hypothetical protein
VLRELLARGTEHRGNGMAVVTGALYTHTTGKRWGGGVRCSHAEEMEGGRHRQWGGARLPAAGMVTEAGD